MDNSQSRLSPGRRGIEVHEIERGGDVTYHGPGQLVGYPILDLQRHKPDLHWYLRQLDAVVAAFARAFQFDTVSREGGMRVGPVG